LALLLIPLTPAHADYVIAQESHPQNATTLPSGWGWGQSFTTANEGAITQIDVYFGGVNIWTQLTLRIVAGNNGNSSASALCEETLTPSSSSGWGVLAFTTPCSVAASNQYTLQVVLPANGQLTVGYANSGDLYPNGGMWVVNPTGGGDYGSSGWDLAFRVHLQGPTAVEMAGFSATPQGNSIALAWETATELDNLGFNLYRAEAADGPRTRLNTALFPSQNPGSAVGASYHFVDDSVEAGGTYFFWLEDVDVHGTATLHGPVSASLDPLRRLLPARPRLLVRPSIPTRR
jgi:hypothetical protein